MKKLKIQQLISWLIYTSKLKIKTRTEQNPRLKARWPALSIAT